MNRKIKSIAFYLPQFHPIPENDEAYGEGFTEWTNVKKAQPLFEGHYQPRVPLHEDYYSLLDPQVMVEQARLAKQYGVYGFCYYHYWFSGGKKLLEKPVEMMLETPAIDIPFCLCWANENWSKRWDGGDNGIIAMQSYGDLEDVKNHVDYLCRFFEDSRYIRIDGAPLLLIYKPELIPNLTEVVSCIREQAEANGFSEIRLAVQYPKYYLDGQGLDLFDYYIQFEPALNFEKTITWRKAIKNIMIKLGLKKFSQSLRNSNAYYAIKTNPSHHDYDEVWSQIVNDRCEDRRVIPCGFVDWDNTARNKSGHVFDGASPEKFQHYLSQLVKKVSESDAADMIFINAWNEWAEGCYLEPDEKYGYAYLEAHKAALEQNGQ